MITHDRLINLLNYNSDSGIFTWKVKRGGKNIGDIAGTKDAYGYIVIMLDTKQYKAHRLAWLYCFEEMPIHYIDHINGNPSDNRLDNLREATSLENQRNQKTRSTSSTGIKGVSLNTKTGKYECYITINKKKKYLGLYNSIEEATLVRNTAAINEYGEFNNESSPNR